MKLFSPSFALFSARRFIAWDSKKLLPIITSKEPLTAKFQN